MAEPKNRSFKVSARAAYILVSLLLFVLMVTMAIAPSYQTVYYDNQLRHMPSLMLTRDGVTEEVELPATIENLKANDRFILTGNYETKRHDSLLLEIEGARVVMFVDDNNAYASKGEVNTYPDFFKSPPPDIMLLTLPNESGSKSFRFEYTVPEDLDRLEIPVVYLGEYSILFQYLATSNVFTFLLAMILILGGALITAFAVLMMQRLREASSLIWLGAACLLAGMIGLSNNDLAIYLTTTPNLLYVLSMLGLLFFTVPFLQYAKLILDPRQKLPLNIVHIFVSLLVLGLLILQLLGLVTFTQSKIFVHIAMILVVITFNAYVFFEYFSYGSEQARAHAIPAVVLLLFTTASSIDQYAYHYFPDNLIFQLGILIFMAWATVLGWIYVTRLLDEAERSVELELEVAAMNRSLDMQRSLYQNLTQSTEEVRRVRHDLRHQLSAIRGYLEKNNVNGALGYVESISGGIPDISNKLLCDNFAVNAVAVYYLNKAEESHIKTEIKLVVPHDLGKISENDMSVVVGNLFENAIEACQHVDEDKRFIRMTCKVVKNRLMMAVDNSFDGKYLEIDGSLYSRKREGRGVGVSSVRTVVERYNGALRLDSTADQFMVSLYVKM